MGLAFDGEKAVYASEGASGVSRLEWSTGKRRVINLNQKGYTGSDTGDLAFDSARGVLYAADPGNNRVAVIDTKSRQVAASIEVGRPTALTLAPDRQRLYVITHGAEGVSHSVQVVNVIVPTAPQLETSIPIGAASGVAVSPSHLYVSDSTNDSITVIDLTTHRLQAEIPIRIPGLDSLRGVRPAGLAWHEASGLLLAAEAGINAVGVIDVRARRVTGHIPTAWSPTRVAVHQDTVFVANARGHGAEAYAGTFSVLSLPSGAELATQSDLVMDANGFRPRPADARPLPPAVKHVVMVVKGNRTYDEFLGDLEGASNGPAMGDRTLARFGASGFADGRGVRLSIKGANIAPNHRAIAQRWSFSDNFYAVGMPAAADLRDHLTRHGVSFLDFGEATDTILPDQTRASHFIQEVETKYVKTGADFPQFVFIHLPNDRMAPMRPANGYPYEESFVADNDYALGRILEFLSDTKWWKEMAVLITEADAERGMDHVDPYRTVLYCAGPWAKRNSVSHANTGFPGLWKTVFRFLKLPPLHLSDATATDLAGCFTTQPDFSPYKALPVDPRVFDPAAAR